MALSCFSVIHCVCVSVYPTLIGVLQNGGCTPNTYTSPPSLANGEGEKESIGNTNEFGMAASFFWFSLLGSIWFGRRRIKFFFLWINLCSRCFCWLLLLLLWIEWNNDYDNGSSSSSSSNGNIINDTIIAMKVSAALLAQYSKILFFVDYLDSLSISRLRVQTSRLLSFFFRLVRCFGWADVRRINKKNSTILWLYAK